MKKFFQTRWRLLEDIKVQDGWYIQKKVWWLPWWSYENYDIGQEAATAWALRLAEREGRVARKIVLDTE